MDYVTSKDGTTIAYARTGGGPALLLIGGSLADHQFYVPLADELAKHFTVYNFDRRGRGESGDTPPYAVAREIEDVNALVEQANEPVMLYGHSAGAALALKAAAAGVNIARLALADPPFTPRGEQDEFARAAFAQEAARVEELHSRGDYAGCVKFFLGGMGLPEEVIEQMLRSPARERLIKCARALPYDYAILGDGLVPAGLAATVRVPTLILAAKATPETAQALVDAMPDARFEPMDTAAYESPPANVADSLKRWAA